MTSYVIAHSTRENTKGRPEEYADKLAARETLKQIRRRCVATGTPSSWMGDDCLQVSLGADKHYYNVIPVAGNVRGGEMKPASDTRNGRK